ncbi:Hypothetical_protein [Hexamita inflata]|uniref:Hypothetical_protein n=1 Tax=Hexamita inflata TaxID=28002 RepID=A0AA86R867_9EUKA|nr:Hypothetical protein HINF_LOCUS58947 [Hexamita inflata]
MLGYISPSLCKLPELKQSTPNSYKPLGLSNEHSSTLISLIKLNQMQEQIQRHRDNYLIDSEQRIQRNLLKLVKQNEAEIEKEKLLLEQQNTLKLEEARKQLEKEYEQYLDE